MKRNYFITLLLIIVLLTITIWVIEIVNGAIPYVDQWTRRFVTMYEDTKLYDFFRFVTNLGSSSFVQQLTIIFAIIFALLFRDWLQPVIFAGGILSSYFLNTIIKHLVARERPSILVAANAEGYSFPSGHAMVSMVCYGLLAFFLTKKIRSAKVSLIVQCSLAVMILLIGISRYFINVHFLTDIVTGFFVGYMSLLGLIYLYEFIEKKRSTT